MKTSPIIVLALVLFTFNSHAQSNFKYSSPESREHQPVAVESSVAKAESASYAKSCGYTKVYYSKSDLNYLMDIKDCVGVRFYNGKQNSQSNAAELMAVAVNADGKEIGHLATNKYLQVSSHDVDANCQTKKLSKGTARTCVQQVVNDKSLTYQKVFFSKDFLLQRLAVSNNGIVLIPVGSKEGSTMMVAAAKLNKGTISEMEANYYRSLLPCPTDCGNTDNYLVSPN